MVLRAPVLPIVVCFHATSQVFRVAYVDFVYLIDYDIYVVPSFMHHQ